MNVKIDAIRHGTIYLSGDEPLQILDTILELERPGSAGKLFVKKTNIEGLFIYGLEQTRAEYFGHRPGYIWSSRASVMNAAFDLTLYEAAYRNDATRTYVTCAVDLVRLEDQLLSEVGYAVDFTPKVSDDKIDVHFTIKPVNENSQEA